MSERIDRCPLCGAVLDPVNLKAEQSQEETLAKYYLRAFRIAALREKLKREKEAPT